MLMPPKSGTCPVCAMVHEPELPHNAESMYYLYRFYGLRGRWPTWADAAAHCTADVREQWKEAMLLQGADWTEPEDGEPIADPPAESFRQAIGDLHSRSFGPEE